MDDRIFFMPGDVVSIKQDISNKPLMIVVKKETTIIKTSGIVSRDDSFKGIRCK